MSSPLVLVVDDSPDDVLLLQNACRKLNVSFNLHVLNDGQRAIEYLSELNGEGASHLGASVMLLDLKMPRCSGFEVLAWIRERTEWQRLPVIIFSSSQHDTDIERAYSGGANCYLIKPVNFDALVEMVKRVDQFIAAAGSDFRPLTELPLYRRPL